MAVTNPTLTTLDSGSSAPPKSNPCSRRNERVSHARPPSLSKGETHVFLAVLVNPVPTQLRMNCSGFPSATSSSACPSDLILNVVPKKLLRSLRC